MSNTQVGNVYQQIIADVVESSRVDFEEGGVDDHVLEELRRGWQQKLSQLQVATFPWDPKPEPQPITNPPMVPSNAGNYQAMGTPPTNPSGLALPSMSQNGGQRIKPEPGVDSPTSGGMAHQPYQNPMLNMPNATTAQQRAAANLANAYGPRAAASINAIQGSAPQPQNPQQMQQILQQQAYQPQHLQQMQQQQQQLQQQQQQQRSAQAQAHAQAQATQGVRPQMSQEQYRQQMAQQMEQQRAQASAQNEVNGVGNAQTDGAGDVTEESLGVIKSFNGQGDAVPMGRIEIDGLIRKKIETMGQTMEGGGLMLPLHRVAKSEMRERKIKPTKMPQNDGGDSDDDDDDSKAQIKDEGLDEDAINSDLDDPEDGLGDDDDDDEGMGHIMLCMYDKVQRVKNKWKCVMKDGVLTVNGKEYVFHKASGEYEW